ncbi:hypothetical protein P175DRAFT_0444468 [Aspergillus ochraceoroseus IBT 24754]|nr:uncharacterized protein P175DRAFT_0444468 [Aspergillus ochraceoroseus IBT 24754]KKK20001.1 hypothetical protein AOCH_004020 [Aspergillus ochraceoroseus]PTU17999.1 hypothetical protein P175DRAFT_0444468 [Aspergillus ochraceoroseus IBT 24754]
MPPRRSHTKSRYGCDQCKKRRVKCDEQGPPCSNCISREIECTYSKAPVARGLSHAQAGPVPVHSTNTSRHPDQNYSHVSDTPPAGSSKVPELRGLELMHKFSTETYQSLCNSPSDYYSWQMIIPRQALNHQFLMSGLLAVASLHIASTMDPPGALTYINTALEYHSQTLTSFRHAIDDINPENCDAVFAHSVVTTVLSIALPQLTTKKDDSPSMTENIIVASELLQGVSNILNICRPWLKLKMFFSGSGKKFWEWSAAALDDETEAALNNLVKLTDDMKDNPDLKRIIQNALVLLRQCFTRFAHSKDIASVLAWLASVDKEFVGVLRCRQPVALLVLMHWGALLHELHGKVWWGRNSGSALVLELLTELHPHRAEWGNAFLWLKQKVGLERPSSSARPEVRNNHHPYKVIP